MTNEVHRIAKERPPKQLKAPALILAWEMYTKHLIREVAEEGGLRLLVPIGMEVEAILTRKRLEEAMTPVENRSKYGKLPKLSETFPAPNAWIPGGYGQFYTKLSQLVNEEAVAEKNGNATNE